METVRKKRIQKPVGIYVVAIAVIIVLGLLQLLRYWSEFRVAEELPFMMAFVPLFLCLFTIASAIWLCVGDNSARITFLAFVSLNFLWWLYLVVNAISFSESEKLNSGALILTLIRPTLATGFAWWYLNTKTVVEYFKQQN